MEPILARKMWATLEPVHAMIYFAPEAFAEWEDLGFPARGMGYFASRSAAMGRVEGPVVAATFYNFNPRLVDRFIPAAWDIASPEDVLAARLRAVDASLRRFLGDEVGSTEMTWAAETAMAAAAACGAAGRPLFAAHAALPVPDLPHVRLWHALGLLREFRGDGHLAALIAAGLGPVEAVASYAATGALFSAEFYRRSRGWSEEEWSTAEDSLRSRGWLDDAGALTEDGTAGREAIETMTDRLSTEPWRAIGGETADRLRATVRPWSRAIVDQGGITAHPDDAERLFT